MRISNKAAQEYYFILKSIFPKVTYEEGRFLKEFKTSLIEFTLAHPHCTYETLEEEFGTPQDILHEYLDMHDSNKISQDIKRMHLRKIIFRCILIAIITSFIAYCMLLINIKDKALDSFPDRLVISIIEEE